MKRARYLLLNDRNLPRFGICLILVWAFVIFDGRILLDWVGGVAALDSNMTASADTKGPYHAEH